MVNDVTVNSRITDTLVQGLLSVIRCMSVIEELLLYPHLTLEPNMEWKFVANIGYMGRVDISQGYEGTSNL